MTTKSGTNQSFEFRFEIIEHIGILSQSGNGWTREVNIVSWNGGQPKIDIREWNPGHEMMSRGITLRPEEGEKLVDALGKALLKRKSEVKQEAISHER